ASLAKLFSGTREPLNVIRSGGLRIFVRRKGWPEWQLLGVPTFFEMGLDQCTWHYEHSGGTIAVRCLAREDEPVLRFHVIAPGAQVLICAEISAGPMEYDGSARVTFDEEQNGAIIRPDPD